MCAFERWILLELQVTNSPFNQEQVELLNRLLPTLNESQRTWLSGFIAALQERQPLRQLLLHRKRARRQPYRHRSCQLLKKSPSSMGLRRATVMDYRKVIEEA